MNRRQARPPRRVDWWRIAIIVASGAVLAGLAWLVIVATVIVFG